MQLGADLKDFINHNQKQIFDDLAIRFDKEVRPEKVGTENAKTEEETDTWELKTGELKTGELKTGGLKTGGLKTEAAVSFRYDNTYNTIVKTERKLQIFVPLIELDVTGVIDYSTSIIRRRLFET